MIQWLVEPLSAAIVFCMNVSVSHIVAEVFWPTPGLVH